MSAIKLSSPSAIIDGTTFPPRVAYRLSLDNTSTTDFCTAMQIMAGEPAPSFGNLSLACPNPLPSIDAVLTNATFPNAARSNIPDSTIPGDPETATPLPLWREAKANNNNNNNNNNPSPTTTDPALLTLRLALRDANQLNAQYKTLTESLHSTCEALTHRIWAFEDKLAALEEQVLASLSHQIACAGAARGLDGELGRVGGRVAKAEGRVKVLEARVVRVDEAL